MLGIWLTPPGGQLFLVLCSIVGESDTVSIICPNTQRIHIPRARFSDFEVGKILGTGSFGRVLIARHKTKGIVCALKMLSKAQMLKTKQVSHVMAEKRVLMKVGIKFELGFFFVLRI